MIEDTAATNAVEWFRGNDEKEESLRLQLLPDDGDDSSEQELSTKLINGALNAIHRIRIATTVSAAMEN